MGKGFKKTFLQKEDTQMTNKHMEIGFSCAKLSYYAGKCYIKKLLEMKRTSINSNILIDISLWWELMFIRTDVHILGSYLKVLVHVLISLH